MSLETAVMVRATLLLAGAGLGWTAIAFFGVAVFVLLTPAVGAAGAAALTGGIAIFVLGIGVLVYLAVGQSTSQRNALTPSNARPTESFLTGSAAALAQLAKDHPLLAIGAATVLGMADSIRAERRPN
jgi:hypothetical protein